MGRADVRDVIVSRGHVTLKGLKPGAVVGTSSPRRTAQALGIRNDLNIKSIRGNVPTRVAKVERGEYDAAIMAAAGLVRLGMAGRISEYLGTDQFLPAPGQGALAVQCRTNDKATFGILQEINNQEVSAAVLAERTFLKALQGGCSTPVGALASVDESGNLQMQVMVSSIDGQTVIRLTDSDTNPIALGDKLARQAFEIGASTILRNDSN